MTTSIFEGSPPLIAIVALGASWTATLEGSWLHHAPMLLRTKPRTGSRL